MSESNPTADGAAHDNPHDSPNPFAVAEYPVPGPPAGEQSRFLRLGGSLGVAACAIGLAILVGACAGFSAAAVMSFIPVLLGAAGFVLALVGANAEKDKIKEDTHVLAALFVCCLGIIGGLVEMAAWRGWAMFR